MGLRQAVERRTARSTSFSAPTCRAGCSASASAPCTGWSGATTRSTATGRCSSTTISTAATTCPHLHKGLDSVLDYSTYTIENGERFCLQSSPMVSDGADARTGAVRTGDRALLLLDLSELHDQLLRRRDGHEPRDPARDRQDRRHLRLLLFGRVRSGARRATSRASRSASRSRTRTSRSARRSSAGCARARTRPAGSSVRREAGEHLFHRLLYDDLKAGLARIAVRSSRTAGAAGCCRCSASASAWPWRSATRLAPGSSARPGKSRRHLPDTSLFLAAWTVGGVYALLGALQIAELGTMLPRSGGQYVFSRHALGDYAGFVVGWSDWLSTCGIDRRGLDRRRASSPARSCPPLRGHGTALAVGVAAALRGAAVAWHSRGQPGPERDELAEGRGVRGADCRGVRARAAEASTPAAVLPPPAGLALATAFVLSLQAVIYTYDGWTGAGLLHAKKSRIRAGRFRESLFAGVSGDHRHLPAGERVVPATCCRSRGSPARSSPRATVASAIVGRTWRIAAAAPHARVDAERDQRLPPDGEPRALRDEPRRARSRTAPPRSTTAARRPSR